MSAEIPHRASPALLEAMEQASEAAIYMPVQRQNMHGGQMAPDVMAAIPVPLWERLIDAFDEFDTGWQPE
jgi:hypothetical protein